MKKINDDVRMSAIKLGLLTNCIFYWTKCTCVIGKYFVTVVEDLVLDCDSDLFSFNQFMNSSIHNCCLFWEIEGFQKS